MPEYIVTRYYTASVDRIIVAKSPSEALEISNLIVDPDTEVLDNLEFNGDIVTEEILPSGRHVQVP